MATFIISVKLKPTPEQQAFLNKSLNVVNSAYNDAVSFCLNRIKDMRRTKRYQQTLKAYQTEMALKPKERSKPRLDELKYTFAAIRNDHHLTQSHVERYLATKRKEYGSAYDRLNSAELQVIAKNAFDTIKPVIYYKVKMSKIKFRSKYNIDASFRNKSNNTGTRLVESPKVDIAFDLYIHTKSCVIPIAIKAFSRYQQECLMLTDKIKYVQIVRKEIRGKTYYYLHISCDGTPATKFQTGTGVVGIDPGVSMVAIASKDFAKIVDLVPENTNRLEKRLRFLDRRLEQLRRLHNPECFNEDGTIKKGAKFKKPSHRMLRLKQMRKQTYRRLTEERRKIRNRTINDLLKTYNEVRYENLNFKELAKRSKEIRINPKTNRPFSKKRFGKSLLKAAPGAFKEQLVQKCKMRDVPVQLIAPTQTKPSQYNHISDTYVKKGLNERISKLSDNYPNVQRDLYSAYLNYCTTTNIVEDKSIHTIDKLQATNDFESFYQAMQNELNRIAQNEPRLHWYIHQ